jgi:hypothetical protein
MDDSDPFRALERDFVIENPKQLFYKNVLHTHLGHLGRKIGSDPRVATTELARIELPNFSLEWYGTRLLGEKEMYSRGVRGVKFEVGP